MSDISNLEMIVDDPSRSTKKRTTVARMASEKTKSGNRSFCMMAVRQTAEISLFGHCG